MKIKEILSQNRNDFTAMMVCEHCGEEHKLTTGYDDANYHDNVIPKMVCKKCGKRRDGFVKCPFCGSGDLNLRDDSQISVVGVPMNSVKCNRCGGLGPASLAYNQSHDLWNKRS